MGPDTNFASGSEIRGYEALLQVADLIVRHHHVGELFPDLIQHLHDIAIFEVAGICLHDPLKNTLELRMWEGGQLDDAPSELPFENTTAGWVWEHQQPLAFPDLQSEPRFSTCLDTVRGMGIRSFCELPLTTKQRRLGTLSLGSPERNLYGENELRLLMAAAQMAALCLENVMARGALQQEKDRLQTLLEINATLVSNQAVKDVFPAISASIGRIVHHDIAGIFVYDSSSQSLNAYALTSPVTDDLQSLPLRHSAAGEAFLAKELKIFEHEQLASMNHGTVEKLLSRGMRSLCCVPMSTGKGPLGTLNLASREDRAFHCKDIGLLKQIAGQIAIALENAQVHHEVSRLKDRLAEETQYLKGEISSTLNFEEIIGESPVLQSALHNAQVVAPSESTVLVLGETGTGKELLARAIHRMSQRQDNNFIKLNCAAIPTGLLESELFGHEKGAFTGAVTQKIGRLELAHEGTLFLDEVGDIPLELQPKLLRVLQDHEFERLGGTRTIRVNIRLIAATNRDLAARIEEGEFRSDLYYRLHVFPIRLPALRERRTDIPLLVRYFVEKFSQKMNKEIERITTETMHALQNCDWQGNIRELENFLERSVILTDGPVLKAPLAELAETPLISSGSTLIELERDHIVRVLRETGGVIAGVHGAAIRLGLKRTTLQSMISRFHITRQEYAD